VRVESPPARIEIRRSVIDALAAHAREEAPNECCGLLVGSPGRVERAVRARNLEASPRRYRVDPEDHFAAIRSARSAGESVLGVYHSHPTSPPTPSPSDLDGATYLELLYLIVRPGGPGREPDVRAYRLESAGAIDAPGAPSSWNFTRVELVTIP